MGKKFLKTLLIPAIFAMPLAMSAKAPEVTQGKYFVDYASFAEEQQAASELNHKMYKESLVLMKNKGNVLPLTDAKNISLFGVGSVNTRAGGSGSGSSGSDPNATLEWTLENAGFNVNKRLLSVTKAEMSKQSDQTVEVHPDQLEPAYGSYARFGDAAFITLSRPGSEFSDNKAYEAPGHSNKLDHILEPQDNELALVKHVKQYFDKVIILVNSASPMELGLFDDETSEYAVDGILWIGYGGYNGIMALGEVIRGTDTPTGRTSDIYPRDFKLDPTWQNYSNGSQIGREYWESDGVHTDATGKEVTHKKGDIKNSGHNDKVFGYNEATEAWDANYSKGFYGSAYTEVEYEEGIYMGYRYYETAHAEALASNYAGFSYADQVVYPFGYGLSYTSFDWTTGGLDYSSVKVQNGTASGHVKFTVTVTNTGSVASKDVVEIYSEPPYTAGKIEKAKVNLVDFQKTKLLQPGESQTLNFEIAAMDFAEFDYNDANGNGHIGYELEQGVYNLYVSHDSHSWADAACLKQVVTLTSAEVGDGKITKSPTTGKEIVAYFSETDPTKQWYRYNMNKVGVVDDPASSDTAGIKYLSRTNFKGTWPTCPEEADLHFNKATLDYLNESRTDYAYEDKATDPWYIKKEGGNFKNADGETVMSGWSQVAEDTVFDSKGAVKEGVTPESRGIDFSSVRNKDINDPAWDTLMNKFTYSEMYTLLNGNSRRRVNVDSLGIARGYEDDGPAQLKNSGKGINGFAWICEVNIASTWNPELCYEQGVMIGNDSLFIGCTGWYGPAVNTHRSPLAGRNFEYYSQDGVHAGKIVAQVVKGAQSKGVHTYLKHYFLNDQEQDRTTNGGIITFCNEQALRQIYLKPFQMAIETGGCNGNMFSFNRVGLNQSCNWPMAIGLRVNEWGMLGVSDSDIGGNKMTGVDYSRCLTYPMGSLSNDGFKYEGVYSAEKNMIMVAKDADEYTATKAAVMKPASAADYLAGVTLESPTQWYAIRNTAKHFLYFRVNTNEGLNGVKVSKFAGKGGTQVDFNLTQGVAIANPGLALGLSDADLADSTDVSYTLSSTLPAGLSFNASKGLITGTPTVSGNFKVSVNLTVDGWISQTATYNIAIASAFTLDKTEAVAGEAFSAQFSSSVYTQTGTYGLADGAKLPAGLTISEDGVISGVPAEVGTFDINATFTYETGSGTRKTKVVVAIAATIVVTGDVPPTVEERLADLEEAVVDLAAVIVALTTATASEIEALENKIAALESAIDALKTAEAADAAKIAELESALTAAKTSLTALEAKVDELHKGCGSSIGLSVLTLAGVALAGLAVAKKARKEDK